MVIDKQALQLENNYYKLVSKFASDLIGLNRIDDICWHLSHNVVAQLGFVDVVIYLIDEDKQTLYQKAAFGNKNPSEYEILDPIEIKIGEGIVGNVAQTKQSILISDTSKFTGYIVDDEPRLSELAVPMVTNDQLVGVVDSEHPEKHFYTNQHLKALEAIAAIAATKLVQVATLNKLQHTVESLEQSIKVQEVLFEISELIFKASSLDNFYESLHLSLSRLTQSNSLYIGLYSELEDAIKMVYFSDERDIFDKNILLPLKTDQLSLTGYVMKNKQPKLFYKNEIEQLIKANIISINGTIPTAWLGVPFGDSELQGIVAIQSYSKDQLFEEKDKLLLSFVAKHIRNAIERANNQSELKFLALHDPLTQLPNRLLFTNRIERAISMLERKKSNGIALLFIDLDRFKKVNDQYGHHIGDQLLISLANKITKSIRKIDTLSRLSGDEFAVLIEDINDIDQVMAIANKIIKLIKQPQQIERYQLSCSVSIGIAFHQSGGITAQRLLQQADESMYQAKLRGRNQVFYKISQQSNNISSYKVEYDFLQAIANNQLILLFQPIVDTKNEKVVAAEALIRWQHPDIGDVSPAIFLPEIDRAGYMHQLDIYVLKQGLKYLKTWQQSLPENFKLNINISSEGFISLAFIDCIVKTAETDSNLLKQLCIEITEQTLLDNVRVVKDHMAIIKNLGVNIALDDFGTGYSSLGYLHQFSFHILKIDRSFIQNIDIDKGSIILKAIVNLAQSLNIETVGEGVETNEQLSLLKSLNCTKAQGFYWSPAVTEDSFLQLLSAK